jgi:type I restriction enzyme S subunit
MANLNTAILSACPFVLPPIDEQQTIAGILGALDDKIDLNRRMNETLEAMARALFKDWFVDFGPTRAKMEGRPPYLAFDLWALFPDRLDDEGKPEGWRKGSLGGEFSLVMGQSPPGDTYNESGDGMPFFQGRTDFGNRYPKRRVYCTAPTRVADADDTLVSVRAPVGDLNMAWERCAIGRGVGAIRHKDGYRGYTYYALQHLRSALLVFDHEGTVFGAINKSQLAALQVIVPPSQLSDAFEETVMPMDDRIRANIAETTTLTSTRDFLLPKLMSGEIRVRDAEKMVEPAL